MKFLLVLLCLFVPFLMAADIPVEDGVLVLGDDNFDEAIAAHSNILVEFYAPWCGHCKSLAPEYAKAAQTLADSPVKLAKVDATEHKEIAQKFEIRGFPTLKFFKNGKPSEYNGGRTESEIVAWLNKRTGPPAVTVSSEEELLKLQETYSVFVLGAFADADSAAAKAFIAAADADDSLSYAITSSAEVLAKLGVTADTAIVLKNFDDLRADLAVAADTTSENIVEFALANSAPLVQEFSQESAKKIFGSKVNKHFLFFTDKDAEYHAATVETYRAAAAAFKGQLLFVNVPITEKRISDFFGITEDDLPAAVLADLASPSGLKKYFFEGEHNADSIKAFAEDYFAGKLTPTLKSENVEEGDATGDVVVLRGKSFNDLVINNDKDVLVEFYAPWCGHCKKLAPTFDELGAKVKSQTDKIIIAKMDSTANEIDVPGVEVRGFPTLYFFKGNDKANPVKYEEGRELENFLSFLEKNAHHGFTHEEL